jgi:hypothetical protein
MRPGVYWIPRFRVWSRGIVERLERRQVAETLEAGSIVVVDEAVEEGIAIGMGMEQPVSDAVDRVWSIGDRFCAWYR